MLKNLQRRFIAAVMLAFTAVMLALLFGINVGNSVRMRQSQEETIERIFAYDAMTLHLPFDKRPPISDMPWAGGRESEFTTRFFVVHCDTEGVVQIFGNEHISSVDAVRAQQYTQAVLEMENRQGIYGDYRYAVAEDGGELRLVFLNIADARAFQKNLLFVSVLIGVCSLLAVFVLVLLFARPAVKPYMRAMERQKRFITDASHELKTPLASIAASADIAALTYEKDEWVENIQQQTARLAQLVNHLVTLSRLDEEQPYPEQTTFSLSEAAWEIAEPFAALAKAQEKSFFQEIGEEISFYGDRSAVQQLFSILLDNAVKYADASGAIRLRIYQHRHQIYIEVSNTCVQAGTLDLERLFDRFYRLDESRSTKTGGYGLGLSIAQMIAAAHGGNIRAYAVTDAHSGQQELLFRITF